MGDPYRAYARHVNPTLGRFLELSGRASRFVRASGCAMEDDRGVRHDDWIAGFGALNLGHNPEVVMDAIRAHLSTGEPNLLVENLNPAAGELAARLVGAAGPGYETCFFCNSGSEAVEAAIKTAVAATGRSRIAYAAGGFHGTTIGALGCMARGDYRQPFEDVLPRSFAEVPFGDAAALDAALRPGDVAGFLLEPIQVEAGVRIAGSEYLRGVQAICRRHGTLLLLDEVQTGMGRTGRLFAFQGAGIEPDVFALAKSLGAGMVPIGAAVMREGIWRRAFGDLLRAEIHASTLGGNALACRVALRVLDVVGAPSFLAGVRERSDRLFGALAAATQGSPAVRRISWSGLLGGIALADVRDPCLTWDGLGLPELAGRPAAGALLVERLARRGILAQVCGHDWSVLRVEPPLTVDEDACDRFVEAVRRGVRWLEEAAAP